MGLKIQCPNCERRFGEETDLTVHVKARRFQVFFNGKTNMTVLCECRLTGTYDPVGGLWYTNNSMEEITVKSNQQK